MMNPDGPVRADPDRCWLIDDQSPPCSQNQAESLTTLIFTLRNQHNGNQHKQSQWDRLYEFSLRRWWTSNRYLTKQFTQTSGKKRREEHSATTFRLFTKETTFYPTRETRFTLFIYFKVWHLYHAKAQACFVVRFVPCGKYLGLYRNILNEIIKS